MSEIEDELEDDESASSDDPIGSFNGLGGATADEGRRSLRFGLDKFGRWTDRVDCVRTGNC